MGPNSMRMTLPTVPRAWSGNKEEILHLRSLIEYNTSHFRPLPGCVSEHEMQLLGQGP
jgi:hypothetical protein